MFSTQFSRAVQRSTTSSAQRTANLATVSVPLATRGVRQRRPSSSKASCPPGEGDGARPVAAAEPQPKTGGRITRRKRDVEAKEGRKEGKSKDGEKDGFGDLPRVPGTGHLQPQGKSYSCLSRLLPLAGLGRVRKVDAPHRHHKPASTLPSDQRR